MDIASKVNIKEFVSRFLTIRYTSGEELACNCPFHTDEHASFSINSRNGLWKCHAPSCEASTGGNLVQLVFHAYKKEKGFTSLKEAYKWFCETQGLPYSPKEAPELSPEQAEEYHQNLLINKEILQIIQSKYHYTNETIQRFKLGYVDGRLTIPIYDEKGQLANIRKKPLHSGRCIGIEFFNQNRLYPIQNLQHEKIYIFEGEKDCLLANQLGLNGITATAGAGAFKQEWIPLFKDKIVYICYDIDEAGIKGAQKIKEFLLNAVKEFKIINLPIFEPKNADFTDYIDLFSKDEFDKLVEKTKPEEKRRHKPTIIPDFVNNVELSEASSAKHYFQRVRLNVIVSGKDTMPYLPPRVIHVKCPMGQKMCAKCGMAQYGGNFEIILDHLSADVLRYIDCSTDHHVVLIRQQLDIPNGCKMWKHNIVKAQNVEEVTIIPEIDYSNQNMEYVVRTAYSIGIGVKANHNYRLEAVTVPHPKTQYATQLIYLVAENKTAIDEFKMTESIRKRLNVFSAPAYACADNRGDKQATQTPPVSG